ncbi:MAG: VWA domain-containing protein [Planctomycetota bacterium]|nr:VWA domain-containing protein [Planctomycetota bacterium]
MFRTLLLCLPLALVAPLQGTLAAPGAEPPARVLPDDASDALDAALKALKRAAGKDQLADRTSALDAVVALANEDALQDVLDRYAKARGLVLGSTKQLEEQHILLERRRVQLAELELAAERKKGLGPKVQEFRVEIEDLERSIGRLEERVALEGPWRDALRDGAASLLAAQGESKRRGLLKDLWKTVEKGKGEDERIASAELLAQVAIPSTAARIAKAMDDALDDGIKLRKGLPPLELKVNDWLRKVQDENRQLGGQVTQGTAAAYGAAQSEAAQLRRRITVTEEFGLELRSAAALALRLQAPETRPEEAADLIKMGAKSVHLLQFLGILRDSGVSEAADALAAQLDIDGESLHQAHLVNALADLAAGGAAPTQPFVPWLLEQGLAAESWHLRARSIAALATLKEVAAIPVLIELLETEQGRLRGDASEALLALTGQDFHGNVVLWRRWWADHAEGFVVPDEPPPSSDEKALEQVGLTFFGLRTESQKVLFVLDVSGSMEFPMVTTSGTGGARGDGEQRMTVAKRELLKALGGIKEGGTFNLVLYASDVWTWADDPVEMDADSRAAVTEFVESIKPVGGTNIYGAMALGLKEARGSKKKKGAPRWVEPAYDTIFLLSDGMPSMGVATDRDGILGMVTEENADLGIVIHTIGLSSDQDAVLMRSLAEQNHGTYAAR